MKIKSIKKIDKPDVVYNLHVKDDHNYVANGVVAKNCQGLKANVLQKLLSGTFAEVPIRWGISGTIPKDDPTFYGILSMVGPIVNSVTAKSLMDLDILSTCNIHMVQTKDALEFGSYSEELKFLTTDETRLDWYAEFIKEIAKSGNTVVLFSRIETGEELQNRIPNSFLVHGGVKGSDREEAYESINDSDGQIVLASFGVASTGINIPRIFNLILIEPGKSFVRVIQSIGRGIRRAKDKNKVEIYDLSSTCKFSKKHFKARQTLYDEAQYPYDKQKVDIYNQLASGKITILRKNDI